MRAVGAAGRDRPAETNDPSTSVARPSKSTTRRAKAFVILPATQRADDGLWTESERGEVLVGTRKARRRQQRSHARWRRVMSLSGVDGTSPTDVQARIAEALQAIEDERQTLDQALRKLERGSKSDVAVSEVKRLKKLKLACKDDAARLRKAASMAAEARTLGEGSFGRVFLGRDVDTGIDVAIKVEDSESVETEMVCESLSWDSVDEDTHPFDDVTLNDDEEMVCNPKTPLTREHDALRRVVSISGQMGLPRVHFFGEQRVLGDAAKVRTHTQSPSQLPNYPITTQLASLTDPPSPYAGTRDGPARSVLGGHELARRRGRAAFEVNDADGVRSGARADTRGA